MVTSDIKISQKVKKKRLIEYRKRYYKMQKDNQKVAQKGRSF